MMALPAPPSGQDDHPGARVDAIPLAPVGALLGIACATTGLRIYWRIRPIRRIGVDDYTLIFALVSTFLNGFSFVPAFCFALVDEASHR